MHSDWETFIKTYTNASPDVKAIIDSEAIVQFADVLTKKYQLSVEYKRILIAQISDLILLLVSNDELASRILKENNVAEESKKALSDDLKHFFNDPKRSIIRTAQTQEKEPVADHSPPELERNEESRISDTNDISPLRTMHQDAERIYGYGEYRKKNPLGQSGAQSNGSQVADLPRYVPDNESGRS